MSDQLNFSPLRHECGRLNLNTNNQPGIVIGFAGLIVEKQNTILIHLALFLQRN